MNIIRRDFDKDKIKICALYFFALLMSYSVFLHSIISSDSVGAYLGEDTISTSFLKDFLMSGRYFGIISDCVIRFFGLFGITRYENTFVFQIIGMLLYAVSATIIFRLLRNYIESENKVQLVLLWFCVLLGFVNPYIMETYFWGAFDFSQGILLAIIGAYFWYNKKLIKAFIFAFLAMTNYENNIIIVMILVLFFDFIRMYSDDIVDAYKYIISIIKGGLFCVGTAVLVLMIQKSVRFLLNHLIWVQEELDSPKKIDIQLGIKGIKFVLRAIKGTLWECFGALPEGILFIALLVIMLSLIVFGIRYKKIVQIVFFEIVTAISFLGCFAWSFLGYGNPPRIVFSVFFVISMICVFLLIILPALSESAKKCIISVICLVFVFVYCNTQICNTDMYISQAIDEYEAMAVQEIIKEHEKETGDKITTVATCGVLFGPVDMDSTYLSSQLLKNYKGDVQTCRRCYFAWGLGGRYINYVTGTDYIARTMTLEEIEEYFDPNQKTIGYFKPEKQLVFEGDTLYWRIY